MAKKSCSSNDPACPVSSGDSDNPDFTTGKEVYTEVREVYLFSFSATGCEVFLWRLNNFLSLREIPHAPL